MSEGTQLLGALDVPNADVAVGRGHGDELAISGCGELVLTWIDVGTLLLDAKVVCLSVHLPETAKLFSGRRVPDTDDAVTARGQYFLAVRGKRHEGDPGSVAPVACAEAGNGTLGQS